MEVVGGCGGDGRSSSPSPASERREVVGAAARGGAGAGWRWPWVTPNLKESGGHRDFTVLLQGTAAGENVIRLLEETDGVAGAGGLRPVLVGRVMRGYNN
jgi:hypothetical protein